MRQIQSVLIQCMATQRMNLIMNAKKHGIEVHGYTEETWNEEMSKNMDNIKKFINSMRQNISYLDIIFS